LGVEKGAPAGEWSFLSEATLTRMPMSLSTCAVAGVVGTCSAIGEFCQPGVRAIMGLIIGCCCCCLLLGVCAVVRGRRGVVVVEEETEVAWLQCWPLTLNASSLSRSRSRATYMGRTQQRKTKSSELRIIKTRHRTRIKNIARAVTNKSNSASRTSRSHRAKVLGPRRWQSSAVKAMRNRL